MRSCDSDGWGRQQKKRVTRRKKKRWVHDGTSRPPQQGLEPAGHCHSAWLQGHTGGRIQQGLSPWEGGSHSCKGGSEPKHPQQQLLGGVCLSFPPVQTNP